MTYRRIIPAALAAGATLIILPGVTYAHSNTVACVDMATSTWRVTNDHPTSETFTTTEGPSGSVAGGAGSYTDVVWNGDTLHVTGTWSDGFVGSTTGTGDCTPDEQPTTTTEAPTSTSTTSSTVSATTTTVADTTTTQPGSTTSLPPTTPPPTTVPGESSTTQPSVVTSSPTTPPPSSSPVGSTSPSSPTTTPGPVSTPPPVSPPQRSSLPATGDPFTWYFVGLGLLCVALGALTVRWNRQ